MRTAVANCNYNIIALDDDLTVITDYENNTVTIEIDQFEGDKLEVWKEREDGFLFVYCDRLEVGYWVIPSHVTLNT